MPVTEHLPKTDYIEPMPRFEVKAPFEPAGDQPRAIRELTEGLHRGDPYQTLLGVTGSGKTMTLAHTIAAYGKPTLVLSHNKTLAAQLYGELKQFLPTNAVEYFVSYYDYYQPEAYVPSTDVYIEKDASINQDLESLRLRATSSLMERDDVVIVSTVSAIYGLGDPVAYRALMVGVEVGETRGRDSILQDLVSIQYQRNDVAFEQGSFRVRGDTIEIFPAYDEQGIRIELWGDQVERISRFHPLTGNPISQLDRTAIYPAKHFVTERATVERAVGRIRSELAERLMELRTAGKLLEAQRLESRTTFDVEMMLEVGTCAGIENYSRHLSGRVEGERPACLLDYFPAEFLGVVDESHVSLPQINGMFNGDRARKTTLVEYGFRLPSALDNRPLRHLLKNLLQFGKIDEALMMGQLRAISVSAFNYQSAESVCFYQSHQRIEPWSRHRRTGIQTPLTLEHLVASAAIPLLFEPVLLNTLH